MNMRHYRVFCIEFLNSAFRKACSKPEDLVFLKVRETLLAKILECSKPQGLGGAWPEVADIDLDKTFATSLCLSLSPSLYICIYISTYKSYLHMYRDKPSLNKVEIAQDLEGSLR